MVSPPARPSVSLTSRKLSISIKSEGDDARTRRAISACSRRSSMARAVRQPGHGSCVVSLRTVDAAAGEAPASRRVARAQMPRRTTKAMPTEDRPIAPQPIHRVRQRAVGRPAEPADDAALRVVQRLHFAAAVGRQCRRQSADRRARRGAAIRPQLAGIEMVDIAEHGVQFVERDLAKRRAARFLAGYRRVAYRQAQSRRRR